MFFIFFLFHLLPDPTVMHHFGLAAKRCCVAISKPREQHTNKQNVTEAAAWQVGDLTSVGGDSCTAKCLLV